MGKIRVPAPKDCCINAHNILRRGHTIETQYLRALILISIFSLRDVFPKILFRETFGMVIQFSKT